MVTKRFLIAVTGGITLTLAVAGFSAAQASQGQSARQGGVPIPNPPPPRDFVRTIDNEYMPLKPGTVLRYRGKKDGQPSSVKYVITRETKTIQGVRCVVVHDTLSINGQPEERTIDWFAQDKRGNVWYFGEDSFDLVGGTWVRSDGSWQAGVDGAVAGIAMESDPRVGDTYRQEYYAGHAEDMAKVLRTETSVTVPYGSFREVLKTKDWTPLDTKRAEHKFFAEGIGEVRSVMVKGGSDYENLVSVER
ncbi:MAG: hypothetical protein M3R70_05200 [Actinomycetota bacterium]|nr:hypothetical protein [Actinomycetota bacterium]